MATPVRFLSGRQQQQKIGIEGSTQNEKVLEVVGRVGIGTTIFEPSKELDVRGDVIVSGELTVGDTTFGTDVSTRNLSASGIATLGTVKVSSGIITAVSGVVTYYGDGSQLNNLPSSGLNEIREEGSVVGSSIESLNFVGNNITVSASGTASTITSSDTPTFDTLDVSGDSTFVGNAEFQSNVDLGDDDKIRFGASQDLQIYHNTSSYIINNTDHLIIRNAAADKGIYISADNGSGSGTTGYIHANGLSGEVTLSHYGIQKFATKSTGIDVTGTTDTDQLNVSGVSTFTGNIDANNVNASGISSATAFANFDYLQAPFGSTVTFTVAVVSKDSSHRYNGTGSGFGYSINGVQAPFLTLTPGRTYRFTNDNTGSHPLKFYLEADKTTEYTSGVSFQNSYTEIAVSDETPIVLHYQCTAHNYMGNAIQVNSNVVNTNYAATLRGGLDVTGVSTFAGAADFNGNVDIDGHTELDNLNVSGVSTFVGLVTVTTGDVHIANRLFVGGLEVEGSGSENTFTGINTFTNLLDNTLGDPDTGALTVNGGFGVNKNASFGSTVFVQNAIGIGSSAPIGKLDVNGHTELDDVNVTGVSTFQGNVNLGDNDKLQFGDGVDLQIFSDGSTSYIQETGASSALWIKSNSTEIRSGGNQPIAKFIDNAGAELYYAFGDKKFETTGYGATVFGTLETQQLNVTGVSTFQSDINLGDNNYIRLGDATNGDLRIYHAGGAGSYIDHANSNDLYIRAGSGGGSTKLRITDTSNNLKAIFDTDNTSGGVELYYGLNQKKFETTGIGVSIINGTSDTATITGPSNLVIDPAAVGDNTGAVRIKGDLFVDGTQTQINSTTIELADFIVGIASTATTDTLADGAGIQIGPDNTFLYEYNGGTNPSLKSSENLNVASGKGYQINQTEVLSATTLGSSVVNSSLTSVGTLGSLTVSGDVTANGNIVGDNSTNITGIDGVTATTLTGTPANTNSNSAFSVTANGSSAYRFTGPGNSGSDDNPDLYLVRGQRYTFTNNSGGSHPFQIRVASGGSAYNDGVTNNGASSGNIVFNVQHDAPARLYYQCTSHGGMVGTIYIVGGPQIISGIVTATTFSGSGASLTALNASNLASGTIPDARFPATLPAISGANLTNLPAATTIPVADESSDTTCFPIFTTAATGSLALKSGSNLTFNSANGTLTATAFSGDGSALTNLSGVLPDVVSDTTPQLGGNLDLNSNLINGTGGINITGIITATTFSGSGASLDTLNASNLASGTIPDGRFPATLPAASGANLTAVDADTLDTLNSSQFLRSDVADTKTSGNLSFSDSVEARFGIGNDLQIYHNGSASYIDNTTDYHLRIRQLSDDRDVVIQSDDGSGGTANYFLADGSTGEAILYHYGTQKLATKSGGVTVTGTLTATTFSGSGASLSAVDAETLDGIDSTSFLRSDAADTKSSGDLTFNDNIEARFGSSADLRIFHDSNDSYISQTAVGDLYVRNTVNDKDVVIQSDNGSGGLADYFRADGSTGEAIVYYNGSQKLATKSGGVEVTGILTATTFSGSGASLTAVDAATLDGIDSTSFLRSDAADTKTSGSLTFNDNVVVNFGTGADTAIYDNGTDTFISAAGPNLFLQAYLDKDVVIRADDGSSGIADYFRADGSTGEAILYHYGSEKLATKSGGVTVTGTLTATTFSGSGSALTNLPTPDKISEGNTEVEVIDTGSDGHVKFTTEGSERARIDSSGKMGIGVTTPGSTLEINGGTSTSVLDIQGSAGQLFSVTNNLTSGSIFSVNDVSGIPSIDVDADGTIQLAPFSATENVGVGTTNPTSKLHVVGDARVTGVITATSFSGSGANLTGLSFDLVNDTTPQLGGTLDTNGNLIQFGDSSGTTDDRLQFGASQDLSIYHDGSNSYIDHNGDGNLYVKASGSSEDIHLVASDNILIEPQGGQSGINVLGNGSVELYESNVKKFETTPLGVNVTGHTETDTLNVSGVSTFNDTVHLPANVQLRFDSNNTTDSLRIYDDGSNSRFVSDHGIFFGTDSTWAVLNENQNTYKIRANSSNVLLYHSGSTKFETTSTGVDVTGTITADGLDMEDSQKILLGTGDDLEIYHDGNSYLSNTNAASNLFVTSAFGLQLRVNSSEVALSAVSDGAVELYYDNSKKLETTTSGVTVTGIVTATSFEGDGSALTGIEAGGSPEFYTGITSSTQITPLSFETSVFTFPSTSGRQYVIESINVANVDESVGVGTTVNIIASIQDATAAEQTYIAYNVPIVTGGLIELLKNPIVAGPSDVIKMWTTNDGYIGVNNAADVYINYTEFESTDYISKFASSTTINTTDAVTLYTSTGNPTMIEKIGFANRTDTGDFPVSIKITNGVTTSYLAKNLIIPRYSTVDILDRHKRIETGAKIEVEVGSTGTIDVIISGKKITS